MTTTTLRTLSARRQAIRTAFHTRSVDAAQAAADQIIHSAPPAQAGQLDALARAQREAAEERERERDAAGIESRVRAGSPPRRGRA
jgi:hypothetical protein